MAYSKIKHVEAAQKHLGQNRVPQAIAEYQQILKHEPGDQVTLMTVGDLYVRQGETFQAIDYFARLAQIFIRDGFLTKAIAIYKKIAKLAPEEMKPLERLAELYVQQGVLSEARPIFLQLAEGHLKAGRREPAAALLRKLLEAEPDNLRVQLRLAEVQLAMGQNQDAAHTLLVCAERQLVNRDPEEAVKLCERAVKLAPENLLARLLMARALSAAGRRNEAAELLESVPDLESGNEASAQLLEIYLQEENTERAAQLARRVLARDPKHYTMAAKVVMIMTELGQADNSLLLLDEIRGTMATNDDAESLAQMLHATAARFTGRLEPHEWLVELYTQINDAFHLPEAMAQLGQAAAAGGHFDRARQIYEQLIERSPEDKNIRANLQQVRAQLGMNPMETAVPTPVPVVEETVAASKKIEEPPLDEETANFVSVALTDVDLFSSYGLTPKAIDLLEKVIVRAPRHTPSLEKLLDLYLGEGNNQRTSELALQLVHIHTERGDNASAERFAELSRRYQRAAALDPAPAAPAAPAEFAIPTAEPEIDASMKAPAKGEIVEEFEILPTETPARRKTAAPTPHDSVHELDLSDEWASISDDAGAKSAEMIPDVEEPEDEREFNDVPAAVTSNRSAFVMEEETENTNGSQKIESVEEPTEIPTLSGDDIEDEVELPVDAPAPEPVPVFANSGSASHAEEEPAEYELELVEQALQPGTPSNVSPIRTIAEPESSPLGDLAMELGLVLDAAPPVAPSSTGKGSERLTQSGNPAATSTTKHTPPPAPPRKEAPKPTVSMAGASDPGGPLSEVFAEFRAELEELQTDEDPETHYNLGIAYREMGLLEEAISEFQKVVQAHDRGVEFR